MKRLNGAGTRALQTIREFTIAQRTIAIIGVAVLVLGGIALASQLSKPTYTPMFSGLSSADASGIVAQLEKDKVDYQLSPDGSTISVPADKVAAERLAAAAAGLPSSSEGGYGLLDKLGVTASDFQQNATYKRAIEGELAKTIESINGVSGASVQLAIPQQTVFTDQQEDPKASVFVDVNTPLSTDQVGAVVHLVSAAYPGLTDANVTVTDQKGDTLSSAGGAASGSAAEQASDYETRTKAAVQAMLDTVLGPGNAVVTVAADVSASSGETTSETYTTPTNAPVLSESNNDTQYTGTGGTAVSGVLGAGSGATGTDTTDTSATSSSGSGSGGNYKQTQGVKNNAVNKTTTKQTIMPGTLNRQTIAVALNAAAAAAITPSALRTMVSNAAGVNVQRGDTVSVTQMQFSTAAAKSAASALKQQASDASASQMTAIITTAIQVVGGLVLFILLMGLLKKLFRKSEQRPVDAGAMNVMPIPGPGDPALGGMAPGAQLGAAAYGMPEYAMAGVSAPPTVALPQAGVGDPAFTRLQADVDALAGSDPERTADYLRALMSDRAPA